MSIASRIRKAASAAANARAVIAALCDAADVVAPQSGWFVVAVAANGDIVAFDVPHHDEAAARERWSLVVAFATGGSVPTSSGVAGFIEHAVLDCDAFAFELVEVVDETPCCDAGVRVHARHEVT